VRQHVGVPRRQQAGQDHGAAGGEDRQQRGEVGQDLFRHDVDQHEVEAAGRSGAQRRGGAGEEIRIELVEPAVDPRLEGGDGIDVEGEGRRGSPEEGGEGEDAGAGADVEDAAAGQGLGFEEIDDEGGRFVAADAEGGARGQPQQPALPLRLAVRAGLGRPAGPAGAAPRGGPVSTPKVPACQRSATRSSSSSEGTL
jgi:hypothetical protein